MNAPSPDPTSSASPPDVSPTRARRGVVVAYRLTWLQRLLAGVIYWMIRGLSATLRYRWEFHPEVWAQTASPTIFCVWHNRLLFSLILYRRYVRQTQRPYRLAAMVSASKDGAVAARVLELFRTQPVRGSSSRRGPQALLELQTWAEQGYDLALTPDGPRGPRYVCQPGAVALAQMTGLRLVPASYELRWKIRLKSWDGAQIPLPFSRIIARAGAPLQAPREGSDETRERCRQELEARLRELTVD
jgi:hypothetical protein